LINVLHLIPHLGGGVGRFYKRINPYFEKSNHTFVLLNEPKDQRFLPKDRWHVLGDVHLIKLLENSDIVQIDFWNHPSLYALLQQINAWPGLRLIAYSHVNGLYPPSCMPLELAEALDLIIFSTKASLYTNVATAYSEKIAVVPEYGGAEEFLSLQKVEHEGFNILYIGTADSTKFLVESIFWNIELALNDNRYNFVYCTQDSNTHLSELIPTELKSRFLFNYAVSDIRGYLSEADIFSYPLQQKHYGTGEQVLLEAMASGLVPLVMNNLPERQIINDGITGILVNNKAEYKSAINFLSQNRRVLELLSINARTDIFREKSASKTAARFDDIYSNVTLSKKTKHSSSFADLSPHELFCLSQGDDGELFRINSMFDKQYLEWKLRMAPQFHTTSKGGLRQWAEYFQNSTELSELIKFSSNVNLFTDIY
jgi:glycosyltransferase involved in cell wall biosynthesis